MKYKILVVDDEPVNLRLLERLFRRTHTVFTAKSGAEGLNALKLHDIALIITDQRMPGMTGIEFLKRAVDLRPKTVRIILTGYTDINDLVEAINSGVIYKYITKPWVNEDLLQTVARGLEHYEAFKDRHDFAQQNERLLQQLESTRNGFAQLLIEALRVRDGSAPERCQRIYEQATALGRWLELDEESIGRLGFAAKLCEIGRLSLNGGPAEEELEHFEMSSVRWSGYLENVPQMDEVALAIRFQHEYYDGNGFPGRICGDKIPLFARILSIVIAFDSLMYQDDRRTEMTEMDALRTIQLQSGTRFDPELVEAFMESLSIEQVPRDRATGPAADLHPQ